MQDAYKTRPRALYPHHIEERNFLLFDTATSAFRDTSTLVHLITAAMDSFTSLIFGSAALTPSVSEAEIMSAPTSPPTDEERGQAGEAYCVIA